MKPPRSVPDVDNTPFAPVAKAVISGACVKKRLPPLRP